jgi:hypothetical protein
MQDEDQILSERGGKPVVVHPGPLSIEDLLQHVDPAPDEETERFVPVLYEDRREAGASFPG